MEGPRTALEQLLPHATLDRPPVLPGGPATGYHTVQELNSALASLAEAHDHVTLETWGTSVSGVPILALRFGLPAQDGAPAIRVLGGHHGDERSSVELALRLAEALAENQTDPRVDWLQDNATTWVVPLINPDGMERGSRYNSRGVDLNRNYDVQWKDGFATGETAFSEPETRAVRSQGLWQRPALSVSLHSGAENLGWPWNYTTDPPADSDRLAALADTYGDAFPGELWMVQGADWYVTHGDTNDWSYGTYGGLDFTIEVSVSKTPPASELPEVIDRHLDPLLELISTPPTLSIQVVDAATQTPVEAVVAPNNTALRVCDPIAGTVHIYGDDRPSAIVVSAPGYDTVSMDLPEQGDVVVSLEPAHLAGAPWPAQGAPILGPVTLTRPGLPDMSATSTATGIEPSGEPLNGPWSIVAPDGRAWPHAYWARSSDPPSITLDSGRQPNEVVLTGPDVAQATLAVARRGVRRRAEPVPFTLRDDGSLMLDLSAIPGVVDVNLLLGGTWVRLRDVGIGAPLDTSDPTDTGRPPTPPDTGETAGRSCGCSQSGPSSLGWLALALLLAPLRRRPAQ